MTASADMAAGGDRCSQHHCPAADCTARSHNYTIRLRGDVKLAAHTRARQERTDLSGVIRTFVEDWAEGTEERFLALLRRATEGKPAATAELTAASGWGYEWVKHVLAVLVADGYVTRVSKGRYACVPGAGLEEGLEAARDQKRRPGAAERRAQREQDMEQARQWYEEDGETLTEIARRLGVPLQTLDNRMDAAGIVRRQARSLDMEQVRIWYVKDGESVREIARRLGVPARTLDWHMVRAGIPMRPRGNLDGTSPAPAPAAPEAASAPRVMKPGRPRPATSKRAPAGTPPPAAANGQEAVITELRERVPDLVTASELAAPVKPIPQTSPGTAVFMEPGGGAAVIPYESPDMPDHGGKKGRAAVKCEHRLPKGAWCRTCQVVKS